MQIMNVFCLHENNATNINVLLFFCILQYWLFPVNVYLLLKSVFKKLSVIHNSISPKHKWQYQQKIIYNKHFGWLPFCGIGQFTDIITRVWSVNVLDKLLHFVDMH